MLLDRDVQRGILIKLSERFPAQISPYKDLIPTFGEQAVIYNLAYLDDHGLTESNWSRPMNGYPSPVGTTITAKGLDFISDDGGLSAILGVVTIKLHQETITALLITQIEKSKKPQTVKQQLIDKVKGLPAEALQRVSLKAMEAGLDRLDVGQLLDKLFYP